MAIFLKCAISLGFNSQYLLNDNVTRYQGLGAITTHLQNAMPNLEIFDLTAQLLSLKEGDPVNFQSLFTEGGHFSARGAAVIATMVNKKYFTSQVPDRSSAFSRQDILSEKLKNNPVIR
jgi:hypothetical protein